MLRLGLFGGSFDPVHLGHILVAGAACEELSLDRLYFIPAAQSPFKPTQWPAPGGERLRLLRLALAGQEQYEVDPQELTRGGVSYTIDTVRAYVSRFSGAELFYLIGADHVAQLPQWREAQALSDLVSFVVIPRPFCAPDDLKPGRTGLHQPPALTFPSPSGSNVLAKEPSFRIKTLHGFPLAVSSSQIRQRVREGLSIATLVPPAVAEAIQNNRLYLSPGPAQR